MSGNKINEVLIGFIIICCCAALTSAGNAETKGDLNGAMALQFEIRSNFTLESFQGSTISFKKHMSAGFAWRLGLDLKITFSDDEITDYTEDSLRSLTENNGNSQNIGLRLQGLFYPNPSARTKLFYGFGPLVGFTHNFSESDNLRPSQRLSGSETSTHTWELGLTGVFGVEWFAASNISLLAEYGSDIYYRYYKSVGD